jgi:prepilin-type N-terminal cleavage/methylation domain-containing protein
MIKNDVFGDKGGFTLIELVMTILLIGIMAVGLYQVIMFGINDYATNENALRQINSLSYASSVIRRNLEEASFLPASPLSPPPGAACPLTATNTPTAEAPIVLACADGSQPLIILPPTCASCLPGELSPCEPSEIAFYKSMPAAISGGSGVNYELIVFCINNNILYKQLTSSNGITALYPVANNIRSINFQ